MLGPPIFRSTIAVPFGPGLEEDGVTVARVRVGAKLDGSRDEKKVFGKTVFRESCFRGIRAAILRCNGRVNWRCGVDVRGGEVIPTHGTGKLVSRGGLARARIRTLPIGRLSPSSRPTQRDLPAAPGRRVEIMTARRIAKAPYEREEFLLFVWIMDVVWIYLISYPALLTEHIDLLPQRDLRDFPLARAE